MTQPPPTKDRQITEWLKSEPIFLAITRAAAHAVVGYEGNAMSRYFAQMGAAHALWIVLNDPESRDGFEQLAKHYGEKP